MSAAYARMPGFANLIEQLYVRAALEVCSRLKEERDLMDEEGDPPDAHQHVDPMPFDYNLDKMDKMGRFLIRHNFH
jgi:hypothetical protein